MTGPGTDASFHHDGSQTAEGPKGERAHRSLIEHTALLERRFHAVAPGIWCLVGNGLSNQTFVEGPDGIIAIDTGESVEEMRDALAELRAHTAAPIVAVLYTHFHYVNGTTAVLDESAERPEIWGHVGIEGNLARVSTEIGPAARRGLIEQFGIDLPTEGEDGLLNVGLGLFFRSPDHAPFTSGFVAPDHTIDAPRRVEIAGLTVDFHPTPSDADDNVTISFPDLGLCVNNIVWPALFNVFPIRGEEYRDPRVLLDGIDHILGLGAEHLVGAHGPPISGRAEIADRAEQARDAIQFLWDQTVRAINRGLTSAEIGAAARLPDGYADDHLTQQHYGLAEHHARQIHTGLRGWFDGDPAELFPLPPTERADRMVAGFGGPEVVRGQLRDAIADDDLRWALELGGWLARRSEADDDDRAAWAAALRLVGQRTTSANIRNWLLTHARELEGVGDLSRHRRHVLGRGAVMALGAAATLATLRVMVVPERADGVRVAVEWRVDGEVVGSTLRRSVLVPGPVTDPDATVDLSLATLADVVSGRRSLGDAVEDGSAAIEGDRTAVVRWCAAIDADGLVL